jgi:hypothetical protein
MGYGFFSDDDDKGKGSNDPFEYVHLTISAVKMGILFANIAVYPLFLIGRLIGKAASERAAFNAAKQQSANQQRTVPPPPRPGPSPFNQYQAPPPPPQPDPLEKYRIILGVKPNANKDEVKRRYRYLSHRFHPDKVAPDQKDEAEEDFKKINRAYTVLYELAPEAPPKPKSPGTQGRKADPPRPKPEAQKPRPEPDRPRQAKTEAPKPTPKPQPETAKTNAAAQTEPNEAAPQPDIKPKYSFFDQSVYKKPKYF